MLVAIIAVLVSQTPTAANPQIPNMSHLAREAMLGPIQAKHTIEWSCSKYQKPSRASITLRDIGVKTRNRTFRFLLAELAVDGHEPSPVVRHQLAAAVGVLNSLSIFEGRCRNDVPGLFITGHTFDGRRHIPKRVLMPLR